MQTQMGSPEMECHDKQSVPIHSCITYDIGDASILSFDVHKCCETIDKLTNVVQFGTHMNCVPGCCLTDDNEVFLVMDRIKYMLRMHLLQGMMKGT